MICPRCSIGELRQDTNACTLCGFSPAAPAALLEEPAIDAVMQSVQEALVQQFRIQAVLQVSSHSFVYLAHETVRDRLVALKVLPFAEGVREAFGQRFLIQAAEAATLRHTHIVAIHSYGATRTFAWYAMEQVLGRSLDGVLRDEGPLSLEATARVVEQVASALDHAHRLGLVHGDLKPTNVFVERNDWVRVSDFGLMEACRAAASTTAVAHMLSSPEYMAPEQFRSRRASPKSDQYALGVLAHQCLTGALPFVGDSFEELAGLHQREEPPRVCDVRAEVPPAMADAIRTALSKNPVERFSTVLDLASAFAAAGSPQARRSFAPTQTPSQRSDLLVIDSPGLRWRVAKLGAVAAALLLAASISVEWLWPGTVPGLSAVRGALSGPAALGPDDFVSTAPTVNPAQPRALDSLPASAAVSDGGARLSPAPPAPTTSPVAVPVAPGSLYVNARPWGRLYVDGQLIGNTPKAGVAIPAGAHTIRVVRDGYTPFERRVDVAPGAVLRLTDIVLEPRQP